MNYKRSDFEIMAPVGSRESLMAALQAGANSIYFGIEHLNMRAHSASAFTISDLREIAEICDRHNVKSYLTVNTIIYEDDIAMMYKIIDAAKESGRRVRVMEMRTQAPDHPALLNEEETQYLKFFVLQVL